MFPIQDLTWTWVLTIFRFTNNNDTKIQEKENSWFGCAKILIVTCSSGGRKRVFPAIRLFVADIVVVFLRLGRSGLSPGELTCAVAARVINWLESPVCSQKTKTGV